MIARRRQRRRWSNASTRSRHINSAGVLLIKEKVYIVYFAEAKNQHAAAGETGK